MKKTGRRTCFLASAAMAIAFGIAGDAARADLIEFFDRDDWIDAVGGDFTTIGFAGFADGTFITDQYQSLGVTFTDGNDSVSCCDFDVFLQDSAGLDGNGNITITFHTPQLWVASDFPGFLEFHLYANGELIGDSSLFGVGGVGNFGGIISTTAFDTVIILDLPTQATIDDFHFGVPAPGTILILIIGGGLGMGRSRRRV